MKKMRSGGSAKFPMDGMHAKSEKEGMMFAAGGAAKVRKDVATPAGKMVAKAKKSYKTCMK